MIEKRSEKLIPTIPTMQSNPAQQNFVQNPHAQPHAIDKHENYSDKTSSYFNDNIDLKIMRKIDFKGKG